MYENFKLVTVPNSSMMSSSGVNLRNMKVGEDGFLVLCTESASTKNGIGSKCDYNFIALDIDIRNKATIIIRPDHEHDSERIHDIYGEKHGYGSHEPYYVLQTDSVNTM